MPDVSTTGNDSEKVASVALNLQQLTTPAVRRRVYFKDFLDSTAVQHSPPLLSRPLHSLLFPIKIFFFCFWSMSTWTVESNCLFLVLSSVIDAASLRSLSHHIKMSSIYLRAGRPGRRSHSTIPNNNVFNSRSSGILQICPNGWSFLHVLF